jgi:hypothetical protein
MAAASRPSLRLKAALIDGPHLIANGDRAAPGRGESNHDRRVRRRADRERHTNDRAPRAVEGIIRDDVY